MAGAALVAAIRLQLALIWWKICAVVLHLFYIQSIKPASQYFHKLVIIGDDFAAGIGDYVTIGAAAGIAQYLAPIVKQSDKVRHTWAIINAGVPGSTSADWLLNSPKQLFNNVFSARSTRDAEIVIIVLGSNETRKKNLVAICDALRKKNKRVCLATVASPSPLATTDNETSATALNAALEAFCKSTATDDSAVVLGPRLDTFAFRRESAVTFDRYHFNSSSFRLLARNAADFVLPLMTSVEWTTWKAQLQNGTYDKALFD